MEKELVNKINKIFGCYKNNVISLNTEDYDNFTAGLLDSAKSVDDLVRTFSVIAVMNGWRMKNN